MFYVVSFTLPSQENIDEFLKKVPKGYLTDRSHDKDCGDGCFIGTDDLRKLGKIVKIVAKALPGFYSAETFIFNFYVVVYPSKEVARKKIHLFK